MDLQELIAARNTTVPDNDPIQNLLLNIQKLDAKRPENLFKLLEKVSQLERKLSGSDTSAETELRSWLQSYRADLAMHVENLRQHFGNTLAEGLQPLGFQLKGQYPKLHAGLFTFDLNFDKGRCRIWYGPEQEALGDTALDAPKVVDTVRKLREKLGSQLGPPDLLARLRLAYRHVRLEQSDGIVPLLALLPFMALSVQTNSFRNDPRKEHYRPYTRADFSFDLYRLRAIGPALRLGIATRQQTRKRTDFLWVPAREEVEGGDYFATIELKEENP
ncbi:MAG: hypothetical protein DCC55_19775 [Chloroflexi bacterium]|nr:MAG: hypothetical protein DCC55_19775 [Chloroflexota bacterium]